MAANDDNVSVETVLDHIRRACGTDPKAAIVCTVLTDYGPDIIDCSVETVILTASPAQILIAGFELLERARRQIVQMPDFPNRDGVLRGLDVALSPFNHVDWRMEPALPH